MTYGLALVNPLNNVGLRLLPLIQEPGMFLTYLGCLRQMTADRVAASLVVIIYGQFAIADLQVGRFLGVEFHAGQQCNLDGGIGDETLYRHHSLVLQAVVFLVLVSQPT